LHKISDLAQIINLPLTQVTFCDICQTRRTKAYQPKCDHVHYRASHTNASDHERSAANRYQSPQVQDQCDANMSSRRDVKSHTSCSCIERMNLVADPCYTDTWTCRSEAVRFCRMLDKSRDYRIMRHAFGDLVAFVFLLNLAGIVKSATRSRLVGTSVHVDCFWELPRVVNSRNDVNTGNHLCT
jgi:hypothetical protein